MFSVAADKSMLSDQEMPGHGKRLMPPPPPPSSKKLLKNLNLNSKNPLLSGNTRMDNDDPWVDFLEATENDSQSEEEKEFEIPPGMEAFAEKIGLMWDLGGTPDQEVAKSPPPSPLFHDYAMPQPGPEEAVWGNLMVSVSPIEVEGRQIPDPELETQQTVTTDITMNDNNRNQGKMNQDIVLTEEQIKSEKIPQFTEADYDKLDAFLKTGLESLLSGQEPTAIDDAQKFDIVEYAMGESEMVLGEDEVKTEDPIMDVDEDYVPDFKKIKAEPAGIVEMSLVENVSIEVIEEPKRKRKVGRPVNNDPITVTVIPPECKLTASELKALKYQRTRELNNQASRRFRLKKKEQEQQSQQVLEELRARNKKLLETADQMEKELAMWKEKVSKINQ